MSAGVVDRRGLADDIQEWEVCGDVAIYEGVDTAALRQRNWILVHVSILLLVEINVKSVWAQYAPMSMRFGYSLE